MKVEARIRQLEGGAKVTAAASGKTSSGKNKQQSINLSIYLTSINHRLSINPSSIYYQIVNYQSLIIDLNV